ncbi:MAG: DUF547 domain-containing protein [Armatimonadetes bacterium]|nr:DUF547 domain-containing protein [Armatimonadota bacterium]
MRRFGWLLVFALVLPAAAEIDHSLFTQVLAAHVRDGLVDYPGIAADARFANYLKVLASTRPDALATAQEKLAFYLNAYNAFVIDGVRQHWPVTTVAGIDGFFDRETHQLLGQTVTLDRLENELLRKLGDARVHAALVSAAVGSPKLRSEAYTASKMEAQLQAAARAWINDGTRNRIDAAGRQLFLSKVFDWYKDDFAPAGGVTGFVKDYLDSATDRDWIVTGDYKVVYQKFDWKLNAAR